MSLPTFAVLEDAFLAASEKVLNPDAADWRADETLARLSSPEALVFTSTTFTSSAI
jgi:hypothetical protein